MTREIKYKVTIIHTAEDHLMVKNKYGCHGISKYNNTERLRVEIHIGQKKYLVGIFDNLDDAIKARRFAEQKRSEGTLVEWLQAAPHGNSLGYAEFWKNELKKM